MRQEHHGAVTRRERDDTGMNYYQHVMMTLSTTPFPIPRRVYLSLCSALPVMTHLYSSTPLFISLSSLPDWEFPVVPTDVCVTRAPAQGLLQIKYLLSICWWVSKQWRLEAHFFHLPCLHGSLYVPGP